MEIQWPLLVFSVLLGISSGIYVFNGIGEVKNVFKEVRFKGALIALILLAIGGCASVLHLGHPERATHLLANIGSGLSMELIAVGLLGVTGFIYLFLAKRANTASKVLGVITALLGLALPCITGSSFMMAARPAWDSITLPLLYLGAGLAAGFLLMAALVVLGPKGKEEGKFALMLALIGVLLMVVTVIAYLIWVAVAPHQAPERSLSRLVSGDLALMFWAGVVLIGLVVPAGIALWARTKIAKTSNAEGAALKAKGSLAGALIIACICAVAGSAILRSIVYLIGTSVEQFIY